MSILAKIQRRGFVSGLFGGIAAAALANVARAQTPDPIPCQLGPLPHQKGPLVWMDMDQIELDAAYDQQFYAPMGDQIQKRVASISNAVRARLGEPLRLSYGPSELEKLDIYRARKPNAPIFLFVHGGSWRGGSARNNAYPAEMFVNAGANFIAIDFIDINQAGGDLRLMARHILPNIVSAIVVQATVAIPTAIIAEAVLSFLGLGVQPPAPSWGTMLNAAQQFLEQAPWMAYWPGLAIFVLALSFNLAGDGLRDALDPRDH